MKGVNVLKNLAIAVLLAYFVATAMPWVDTTGAVCAGFLAAELAMYFLTAYDEIIKQRERRSGRNRTSGRR